MEEHLGGRRGQSLQCPRRFSLGTSRVHQQLDFGFEDHSFGTKPLKSSLSCTLLVSVTVLFLFYTGGEIKKQWMTSPLVPKVSFFPKIGHQ